MPPLWSYLFKSLFNILDSNYSFEVTFKTLPFVQLPLFFKVPLVRVALTLIFKQLHKERHRLAAGWRQIPHVHKLIVWWARYELRDRLFNNVRILPIISADSFSAIWRRRVLHYTKVPKYSLRALFWFWATVNSDLISRSSVLPTTCPKKGRVAHTQGPNCCIKACSPTRGG